MLKQTSLTKVASLFLGTCLTIALCMPAEDAAARAGGGRSMGSRGSHTFAPVPRTHTSPFSAAPIQRSYSTPPRNPSASATQRGPTALRAPYQQRPRPFASGFVGGLLGAGLFGLLMGHGFFGGVGGGMGFLGLLLQLFLLFFLVRWVMRRFGKQQTTAPAAPAAAASRYQAFNAAAGVTPGGNPQRQQSITITPNDYQTFQQLLVNVQAAWSQQNIGALQRFATPEMVSYFNEQLSALSSRGARNIVSDLKFEQGDLAEAWREGNAEYATVAMRYSMFDITTDATGRVIDGSSTDRTTVTELWTFVRAAGGGNWMLSAIQQASMN